MTYRASWDTFTKLVTAGSTGLFAFPLLAPVFTDKASEPGQYCLGLFLFAIYFFCYAYRPVSYKITSGSLIVHRPFKDFSLGLDQIRNVELLDDEQLKWTIRTFGVGGLFGYFGKFTNARIGSMTWYATRRKRAVLVQTTEGKKIILTPDEPENFVQTLKAGIHLPA